MNVARQQLRQCSLVQVIGNEHSIQFDVFCFWSNAGFFLFQNHNLGHYISSYPAFRVSTLQRASIQWDFRYWSPNFF